MNLHDKEWSWYILRELLAETMLDTGCSLS